LGELDFGGLLLSYPPPAKSKDVLFLCQDRPKCLLAFKDLALCSVSSGSMVLLLHDLCCQAPQKEIATFIFFHQK
jgi:hypothetical protein